MLVRSMVLKNGKLKIKKFFCLQLFFRKIEILRGVCGSNFLKKYYFNIFTSLFFPFLNLKAKKGSYALHNKFTKSAPTLLYPFLFFNNVLSHNLFNGSKEHFFRDWVQLAQYLLKNFLLNCFSFFAILTFQFYYPFALVPSRRGRVIFRIPQNISMRRTFNLLGHRLKKNILNLGELCIFSRWVGYLLTFLKTTPGRYPFYFFQDTLILSTRNISRRRFRVNFNQKKKKSSHLVVKAERFRRSVGRPWSSKFTKKKIAGLPLKKKKLNFFDPLASRF